MAGGDGQNNIYGWIHDWMDGWRFQRRKEEGCQTKGMRRGKGGNKYYRIKWEHKLIGAKIEDKLTESRCSARIGKWGWGWWGCLKVLPLYFESLQHGRPACRRLLPTETHVWTCMCSRSDVPTALRGESRADVFHISIYHFGFHTQPKQKKHPCSPLLSSHKGRSRKRSWNVVILRPCGADARKGHSFDDSA